MRSALMEISSKLPMGVPTIYKVVIKLKVSEVPSDDWDEALS
jgi:hypothetical protein